MPELLPRRGIGSGIGLAILWFAAAITSLSAAEPTDPLLQLVGSEAGLCFELIGLKQARQQFQESELYQRLEQLPVTQQWLNGPDVRNLLQVRRTLDAVAGQPLEPLLERLFGTAVVLAVYVPEEGEPQAVVLTQAESAEALRDAFEVWRKLERREETSRSHAGRTYLQRKKGDDLLYVATLGDILILSASEPALKRSLDLAAVEDEANTASLLQLPVFQEVRGLMTPGVGRLFVQPRAWDERLAIAAAVEDPDLGRQMVARLWQQCRGWGASVRLDQGLMAEAVITLTESEDQPSPALARWSGPAPALDKVPARALFAFSSLVDFGSIGRLVHATASPNDPKWRSFRQVMRGLLLGNDLLTDILPQVGPGISGYVVPRAEMRAGAWPVEGLLVVNLPPAPAAPAETDLPSARAALENAFLTGLNFLIVHQNSAGPEEGTILRQSTTANGILIRSSAGPGPYQPAFAITPDALIVASRVTLIEEYLRETPADLDPAETVSPARALQVRFPAAGQVVLLNLEAARRFLKEQRDFLIQEAVASRGAAPADLERRFSRVEEFLAIFETASVVMEIQPAHVRLRAGATTIPAGKSIENAGPETGP